MPFMIYCDNKGCMANCTPLLDPITNDAICDECGKKISNITSFAKKQMKSLGQVKKIETQQTAFSVPCKKCNKTGKPIVKNNKAFCFSCSEELNLTSTFIRAIASIK